MGAIMRCKEIEVGNAVLDRLGVNYANIYWHRARKDYDCCICKETAIHPGDEYFQVYYPGSGLRGMKFPSRICLKCATGESEAENYAE